MLNMLLISNEKFACHYTLIYIGSLLGKRIYNNKLAASC